MHAESVVITRDHLDQARDKILLGRVRSGVVVSEEERRLIALHEAGRIKPPVDRTFRFEEAAAAHHYIHDRKAVGKVVLVP